MKKNIRIVYDVNPFCTHGIEASACKTKGHGMYFCDTGLKRVLNVAKPATIAISPYAFKGSFKVRVDGPRMTSKFGSYIACDSHPLSVRLFLGYEERTAPSEFCFYARPNYIPEKEEKIFKIYNRDPNADNEMYGGVSASRCEGIGGGEYFCGTGLETVLGVKKFKEASISPEPFNGAIRVLVQSPYFESEIGRYRACLEHPQDVHNFMGGKGEAPDTFSFYVRVDK